MNANISSFKWSAMRNMIVAFFVMMMGIIPSGGSGIVGKAYADIFDDPNMTIDIGDRVVKKQHPRIWLTPERIQRLRQDAANRTEKFLRLESVASGQKESSVRFQVVLNYLLAYITTDDPVYADRAIAKVDKFIATKYGNRYKAAQNMMSVALVYDWLYDYPGLTDAKKASYINWLTKEDPNGTTPFYVRSQYDNAYVKGNFTTGYQQSWHNYHFLGMLNLFITGAATIEDPNDPQAAWINEAIDHWFQNTKDGLAFNGEGGGSPEDDTYWQESICFLSRFCLAVETACGETLAADLPYLKDRLRYSLFTSYPKPSQWNGTPAWEYLLQGDANWNINSINHYHRMAQWMLIELLPNEQDAHYLQSWLTQSAVTQTYNYKFAGEEFLWAREDRTTLPYSSVTPSHFAKGTGRVLMRENWNEDATHIGFQSGDHFEYHQHYAQGHFSLFKDSPLLVDSGKYEDTYGSHARNYYYRTIAHNSLVVYDDREGSGAQEGGAWYRMRGSRDGINDGGQIVSTLCDDTGQRIEQGDESVFTVSDWFQHESIYDSGEIPAYEDAHQYVFVTGDASKAYHDWKISHFDRNLLYLRDADALVVLDRVSVPQSQNKKRMLFHFQGEPIVSGQENKLHGLNNPNGGVWRYNNAQSVDVSHDGATLSYIPVYPTNPEIVKIGGADLDGNYDTRGSFEYWVPYDGNNIEAGGQNYFTNSSKKGRGQWRIEVSPSSQQVDDLFLHIFIPRSQGTQMAEPTVQRVAVTSQNMIGASLISDAIWVALFSNHPQGNTVNQVNYTLSSGGDKSQQHIIANCEPGSYDVYQDGVLAFIDVQTSQAGIVMFTTSGGRSFSVVRSGGSISDTTPPTMPANVSGQPLSSSSISLSWSPSTDDTGVSGYNIYRDGQLMGVTSQTSFTDTRLQANTTYDYSVSAFDAAGNESSLSNPAVITTEVINQAPVADINQDHTQGTSPLTVQFDAGQSYDPDGDTLTYQWNFGDGTFSNAVRPAHIFTVEDGDSRVFSVELRVSDGDLTATDQVNIQVAGQPTSEDNQPPTVNRPAWQSIKENAVRSFTIQASDPDGDALTYILDRPQTFPWIIINGNTVTLSPTYSDATRGSTRVNFSVSDGQHVVNQYFEIKVVNVDQHPVFDPIAPVTLSNGQTQQIQLKAVDPDGANISYAVSLWGHLYDWVSLQGNTITLTPTHVKPGTHRVNVYAKGDGWKKAKQQLQIQITNSTPSEENPGEATNSAPVVTRPSWQSIKENEVRSFTIQANDPDGDALIFALDQPQSFPWISMSGNTVTLSPTFSDATKGSARVNFSVSDGQHVIRKYFEIKVVNVDQHPVFDPIAPVTLSNGQTRHIQLHAIDPDGVGITYTVSLWGHLYDWVSLQGSTITLTPTHVKSGTHRINVYAKGDGWKKTKRVLEVDITQ